MSSDEARQIVAEALLCEQGIRVPTPYPPSDYVRQQLLKAAMDSGEQVEIATRVEVNSCYFLARRFKP